MSYGWRYRCSACERLVEVDDVRAHVDGHRERQDYDDGHITLTRVDRGDEREGEA